MNTNDIIKKAFDYNRKGIESIFNAAEKAQTKAEEYTGKALDDAPYVPDEGKAFVRTWFENGRKIRTGFKDAVLKGHERFESLLTPA